jgi:hypothetical protein
MKQKKQVLSLVYMYMYMYWSLLMKPFHVASYLVYHDIAIYLYMYLQGCGNGIAMSDRRVATRTQKCSCVHIENFDKYENMVNLGHKVE